MTAVAAICQAMLMVTGAAPSPPGGGLLLGALQFDTYPFVDDVPENTQTYLNINAGNQTATAQAGAGAFTENSADNFIHLVQSEEPFPLGLKPLGGSSFTMEGYFRWDGTPPIVGETWVINFWASFTNLDFTETFFTQFDLRAFSGAPRNGNVGIRMQVYSSSVTYDTDIGDCTIPVGAYIHIAVVVDTDEFRIYAAGILIYTVNFGGTFPADQYFQDMGCRLVESNSFPIYLDSYALTTGAKYTANFAPPTGALP